MFLPQKRNVVIVRAGANSLHSNWLKLPYQARSFDVVVSYYDEVAFDQHQHEDGVFAFFCIGGKWDGLHSTINWMSGNLSDYEYYWLPDDDIDTDAESINLLFNMMTTHSLAVAQPSLTPDSYFTHFIFINCPKTTLRFTNYIEIMVPCLAADILLAVLPHFRDTMSGFGLDYIWCRLSILRGRRAAIIDSIQVRHTRPVGNVLVAAMAKNGRSPEIEEEWLKQLYGIDERVTPLVYEITISSSTRVSGQLKVGIAMTILHLLRRADFRNRNFMRYGLGKVYQLLRRQVTRKLNLSPIQPKH